MANTIIFPFSIVTYSTTKINKNLPDIVNDCEQQLINSTRNEMKIACKQIAHSLRLVADQVEKKYYQVSVKEVSFYLYFVFLYLGSRF
jgi:hypothetical protein